MKEVIRVDQIGKEKEERPVEFTHFFDEKDGWKECFVLSSDSHIKKIIYLGNSLGDGDMFAVYCAKWIFIYKGHLNSGKY